MSAIPDTDSNHDGESDNNPAPSSECNTTNGNIRSERKSFGVRLSNFLGGKVSQNDNATQGADDDSEELHSGGQRPVRKELLESNLDQVSMQQKLKEGRLTTQEKHRKHAKEGVLATKRQKQPSPSFEEHSNDNSDRSLGVNNQDPSFSVAPKQPEHKRHADDVDDESNEKMLYLYEPAKVVHGSKKKHRLSVDKDSISDIKSTEGGMSTVAAAAAAAAEAEGPHDKRLWVKNLDIPQWIVIAAPAALSALLVGATIYFMKSAVVKRR